MDPRQRVSICVRRAVTDKALPSRRALLAAVPAVLAPGLGFALASPEAPQGWREAVVIVPDLAPWIETLTVVGGWEMAWAGPGDAALNAFWSLPPGARTERALMRNIGTHSGFIRLVKLRGAEQKLIRPDDQAWDTGAIQALDVRVVDIEATRSALHARGWRAPSDPVRYKTYGVEVIQWAPSSPDGVRLSFIQRIAPPLVGWAELKRWGRVTNAAITVKDMDVADRFYSSLLALTPGPRSNTVGSDGPNVMGMPWAFSRDLAVDIRGFYGPSRQDGSIELISMKAAQGRDFSADAHPPNLGIAALRLIVADATALALRLSQAGVSVSSPMTGLVVPPYGPCKAFAVLAPDGVRLEFLQPLAAAA